MTTCIGRMMGKPGDWYAELNFREDEANVMERRQGGHVWLATVPLGRFTPETPEAYAKLDPADAQNKRLCAIVFAPEAWALLKHIRERLQEMGGENTHDVREELIDAITNTLDGLEVPTE
jgi:hypothetical protein